ncbi:MAG: hypothetical protein Q8K27_01985, partial [Betaproteobacteria bacterium]|nr:hypothetical protein [Betaproteobacteria bacterium]
MFALACVLAATASSADRAIRIVRIKKCRHAFLPSEVLGKDIRNKCAITKVIALIAPKPFPGAGLQTG